MTNKNLKFEDAMKRLEEIVEQMEKGDINLDKSLSYFEEGIKLVRFCSSKLEEVKKKVEILVKKGDKMSREPFAESDENNDTDNNKKADDDMELF
ncbi:MAG: exodeoxyribonuclease VII small subunit [Endomicrobiales bacterium]|nr:exodeoxyribonuclease VII small subunit [Endomicrobiales bacterium]